MNPTPTAAMGSSHYQVDGLVEAAWQPARRVARTAARNVPAPAADDGPADGHLAEAEQLARSELLTVVAAPAGAMSRPLTIVTTATAMAGTQRLVTTRTLALAVLPVYLVSLFLGDLEQLAHQVGRLAKA